MFNLFIEVSLYLNNIRMLISFLDKQEDPKSLAQFNIFISVLDNIISHCIDNYQVQILQKAFKALKILFKSLSKLFLFTSDVSFSI